MRLPVLLLSAFAGLGAVAAAAGAAEPQATLLSREQRQAVEAAGESHAYQSDIARLMRVVVSHLYHDRDVFIRELLSNANDALEKTRLLSLTDSSVLATAPELNVTVFADPEGGRIVIRDTGVGMSKDALVTNLGTLARSGTSDFLEKLEKGDGGNLIGQFGLGFYSSFLVADRVTVASKSNDDPVQHIFESEANAGEYKVAEDPRGNTLGRGTEITLWIKDDAKDYISAEKLHALITKHSEYSTTSPIYLWTTEEVEEIVEEDEDEKPVADVDDDEVKVEDEEERPAKTKTVKVQKSTWNRVNDRPPLWMRNAKDVSDEEYKSFYKGVFKDALDPLTWTHFKGDADSTTFRALIYVPETVPTDFYSKSYITLDSLRLFVRRVFITSEVGPDFLPKWLNWIKVFVDADDLPLNVGRDSLQKSRALGQIQRNLAKRTIDLFTVFAKEDPEKYNTMYEKAGVALKVGVVEDAKNRARLAKLLRFETSASSNLTSLDEVISRRKKGQDQIFFIASVGEKKEQLERSPFVERIIARGYEVLYFGEPMDEMIASTLQSYDGLKFQDVAKKGLRFGDEEEDKEGKREDEALMRQFEPLSAYLVKELGEYVNEVVVSMRLTTSPCLVVTDSYGWTGNMERLMAAQNSGGKDFMAQFMKSQKKTFEINPKHPLIEGLLDKLSEVEGNEVGEAELKETVEVLWQTSLVRSGFSVPDPAQYFHLVESILRRSLGVSETAKAHGIESLKPAPPVDTTPINTDSEEANIPDFGDSPPEQWANWADMKKELKKEAPPAAGHDEL